MDVLTLIKNRRSIRRYQNKQIPKRILNKIIEAGVWGPALLAPGFQPWKFIVIRNKGLIIKIATVILKKSKKVGIGISVILRISAETIFNAPILIVVYNSSPLVNFAKKIDETHIKFAQMAELCAISAAIQNMVICADNIGIGSCWLDTPLFCSKKISQLLNVEDNLVAILTFGYPAEKGRRSSRKPISETVEYKY